jgi:hypothetical protein
MHEKLRRFLPPGIPAAQIACCIGLLSDTHMPERCVALPPALDAVLHGVDLLLHAGDVGELWVLDRLTHDGVPYVSHVDLARPAERYVPAIDWAAGFRAALDDVSCSILSPDLAEVVARLTPRLWTLGRAVSLRAAQRCWSGEQAILTHADLLTEINS